MAIGDVVSGHVSLAAWAYLSIRPGAGTEWVIHNIYHEASVELYLSWSSDDLLFDTDPEKGSWSAYFFHLTNAHFLRVKNMVGDAKLIGYDGIVTKE